MMIYDIVRKIKKMILKKIVYFFLKNNLRRSFRYGYMEALLKKLKECLDEKDIQKAITAYVMILQGLEKCAWEFESLAKLKSEKKQSRFHEELNHLVYLHKNLKDNSRLAFMGEPIFLNSGDNIKNIHDGTYILIYTHFKNSFNESESIYNAIQLSKISGNFRDTGKEDIKRTWDLMTQAIRQFYFKLALINKLLNPPEIKNTKGMEAYDPLPLR